MDDTEQRLSSVAVEVNEEDVELGCSTETCTDAPTKRQHSNSEHESDVSTDCEDRLVIDCSDVVGRSSRKCTPIRNGRKSISWKLSQNDNDEDSRVTRSRARLIGNMPYINQSVGEKSKQFAANEGCEMDSIFSYKNALEATGGNGLEKSLEDVMVSSSVGATENTLCSEGSESTTVPKGDCITNYGVNVSMGSKQDCCVSQHCSAQEVSEEEQTMVKKAELNFSNPGFNISYRLWKLCKDEGHLGDHKEGFLKGECPNREINILVRCKVDGHEVSS